MAFLDDGLTSQGTSRGLSTPVHAMFMQCELLSEYVCKSVRTNTLEGHVVLLTSSPSRAFVRILHSAVYYS